jgi:hypothetical protein
MAKAKFDKRRTVSVAFLLFTASAFVDAGEVNFDGNHAGKADLGSIIEQVEFSVPARLEYPEYPMLGLRREANAPAGKAMSKRVVLNGQGEEVEVPRSPDAGDPGKAYYKFKPLENWRRVAWCHGQEGQYYRVCLTYKLYPNYGGHNHFHDVPGYTWQNSTNTVPARTCSPVVPVNIDVRWPLTNPAFATRIEEKIEFYGACGSTYYDTTDIKIDGLELLAPAWEDSLHGGVTYYTLIGSTMSHPINHFGKPSTITTLKQIAWDYYLEFSTYSAFSKLEVNDMSLRWGGLFDIGGNWRPPHSEHRYGRQADLRRIIWSPSGQMIYMPKEQEDKLVEIACKNKVEVLVENKEGQLVNIFDAEDRFKSTAPHFHLRFPLTGDDAENPPDVAPDLSRCPGFLEELKNERPVR